MSIYYLSLNYRKPQRVAARKKEFTSLSSPFFCRDCGEAINDNFRLASRTESGRGENLSLRSHWRMIEEKFLGSSLIRFLGLGRRWLVPLLSSSGDGSGCRERFRWERSRLTTAILTSLLQPSLYPHLDSYSQRFISHISGWLCQSLPNDWRQ